MSHGAELGCPDALREYFPADVEERLSKLRCDLHAHPELAFHEHRTAEKLEAALAELGIAEVRRVTETGLIARIPGADPNAPVVAVRGDIDALPIHEKTGLPWTSKIDGVMHACGHDVHATWAVATGYLLAQQPAHGDVAIILQPAEEGGCGAPAMIEAGVLEGVSAIFGGHVDRRFEVRQVVAQEGPLAASSETFRITLRGTGAHGARPHESNDPVVGLGALIGALQTVVSRRLNPAFPGVVTIGKIQAGTAPNIIPENASLAGTMRATSPETRALLRDSVEDIARKIADAYYLDAEIVFPECTPAIVNPPETVAWAREAAANVLGDAALTPLGFLNLGGEDFSYYMERIPGCFMRIGAREPGGEILPAHSPYFYAAGSSIFVGAAVLAECARVASAALARNP